jgi:myosin heavy subunit
MKFSIPSTASLSKVKDFIKNYSPFKIQSSEDVETASDAVKKIKSLITKFKEDKKAAEEPFEKERKLLSTQLDKAKDGKKSAGEPYAEVIKELEDKEAQLRASITEFAAEQQRLKEAEERRIREAEALAEKKRLEAERLKEEARRTGEQKTMMEAFKAQQALNDAEIALAQEEQNCTAPVQMVGTTTAKRVDFEVEDILKVPTEYVEYIPNRTLIADKIAQAFPFLKEVNYTIDINLVPDELMHDAPIKDKVIKALREGIDIPGIKKTYKESLVVR